jgi:hypothetical protein
MTIALNPQNLQINSVLNGAEQCAQPKFIHVPVRFPSGSISSDANGVAQLEIDLTPLIEQGKIDAIRGMIARIYNVEFINNIYTNTPSFTNNFFVDVLFSGGFVTALSPETPDASPPAGWEYGRAILAPNPPQILLNVRNGSGSFSAFFADIFLTNFEVRPYTQAILLPGGG